ncbi:MAG: zinc ribbon domain-containing protein [Oscillospiraceae bacterium]|nr:zinc ribbon domain-containing protein [Oscillospiraceae bacterium]
MFENLGKKLSETGKAIGDKTKQVSETTQLSYKISVAEKEKETLFAVLGKSVYEEAKADSLSPFFGKCEEISAKQDEIDEMKKKLDIIKGVIICSNCGAECDKDNDFCGKCGSKLEKPIDPPIAAETETAAPEENTADDTAGNTINDDK